MKKNILLLLTLTFFIIPVFSQSYHFKFKINDKSELKKISKVISIDNYKDKTVWAYANDDEFVEFAKFNYQIEKLPLNSNASKVINMATTVDEMANWDRYPTYDTYIQMMNDFANNYPDICKIVTIGTSQNGKQIIALKISDNVNLNEQEPEFFYTSSMHGDETTGIVLMLRLAYYLLSNYGTDAEVNNLVNNFDIFINPIANPDGTYKEGDDTVDGASRYLADGQDPNRDFPDPENSNSPYSTETQDMMDFATNHHFVIAANFHGGAEVMNYPWDIWTTSENANADANWFEKICINYVQTARTDNSSYMTDVTSDGVTEGADWYPISGGRQDYMNYFQHCKEVTIELSSTKTLSSDLLPSYWTYNKQALLDYIKEASYGIIGTVKNENDEPLDAKIEISNHDKDNSWVVTDSEVGDYYRPIEPGTYDVTYSSDGYVSQIHTITVSDWKTSVIKDVVLSQAGVVNVTGSVLETGSSTPLEDVKIEFLNTSIPIVYTDANGNYNVNDVTEDIYQIKASKLGYTPITKTVDISTTTTIDFTLEISDAVNFEDEIPNDFTFSGDANWIRTDDKAYDGTWSIKSGAISDNESSIMEVTKTTQEGTISFQKFVSSEDNYDFLRFYIDDVEKDSWSGINTDWNEASYNVSEGTHTYKWEYIKDQNTRDGDDCAWVDFINFPPAVASTNNILENNTINISPNPFKETTNFEFYINEESNVFIGIYSYNGQLIKTLLNNKLNSGNHIISWNGKNENNKKVSDGLYFCKIINNGNSITKKIILMK